VLQEPLPKLVLASASATRRALLASAGLQFDAVAAGVDEDAAKQAARALDATAATTAMTLARLKANAVQRPGSVVIGCDQILVCDGAWYDKPANLEAARVHLQNLRGRAHVLATATVVVRGGVELWQHTATPRLTMRHFSEAFLDRYLAAEGVGVLSCVGAYRLEGLGAHLFERVEGDHSAILGLPLLPLLGFLRGYGLLLE
jgi:septum formation protein